MIRGLECVQLTIITLAYKSYFNRYGKSQNNYCDEKPVVFSIVKSHAGVNRDVR